MRMARTVGSTLTLLGCSPGNPYRPPTYPEVPDSPVVPVITPTSIWGMVVEESGGCIVGATVTVVREQASARASRSRRHVACGITALGLS